MKLKNTLLGSPSGNLPTKLLRAHSSRSSAALLSHKFPLLCFPRHYRRPLFKRSKMRYFTTLRKWISTRRNVQSSPCWATALQSHSAARCFRCKSKRPSALRWWARKSTPRSSKHWHQWRWAAEDALGRVANSVLREEPQRWSRRFLGSIMKSPKPDCQNKIKKKFPEYFKHRKDLSSVPLKRPEWSHNRSPDVGQSISRWPPLKSYRDCQDKITCLTDGVVAWTERRYFRHLQEQYSVSPHSEEKSPNVNTLATYLGVHAAYCGPLLQRYYSLIVMDSYSKWPEVFLATKPDADFTLYSSKIV